MIKFKLTFAVLAFLITMSCSKKQDTVQNEEEVQTEQISKVKIPDIKDSDLRLYAEGYDTFINKTLLHYKENNVDALQDLDFQSAYKNDSAKYYAKMEIALKDASAKDVALFQQYILAKQQELQEQTREYYESH